MKKYLLMAALGVAANVSATPRVASSIYPLQQIANAIVGEPTELVTNTYLSPHHYAIKPADAALVAEADIVLWVGASMMPQLDKYIDRRSKDAVTITAAQLPEIKLLESDHHHHHGEHDDHDHGHKHDDHDHGHKHDDHDHGHKHDDHDHGHKHDDHDHGHKHDDHDHGHKHDDHKHDEAFNYDPHVWLSTHNAGVIAKALTAELVRLDKDNEGRYNNNLKQFLNDLAAVKTHIIGNFESNPAPNYFIFHNAYAYFEDEFGIEHSGVIRLHAGQTPKAAHLNQLKKQLAAADNACLFSEPQFDAKIVKRLVAGSDVKVSQLDPVGYEKDKNIGYPTILKNIAQQIATCRK